MINPYQNKKRRRSPDVHDQEIAAATRSETVVTNLMPTSATIDHMEEANNNDNDGACDSCCSSDEMNQDGYVEADHHYMPLVDKYHDDGDQNESQTPALLQSSKIQVHYDNNNNTASEQASALVIAASDKAGMDQNDRTRIDEIILRESGNSLYIQQQKRRDQKVNERIEHMKRKLREQEDDTRHKQFVSMHKQQQQHVSAATITAKNKKNVDWRRTIEAKLDSEMNHCLQQRRPHSTMVVVDMDMFYMACELLTRPDLRDKPACVGTGVILTSNYCARKYGVRSALAGWIGDKLVHELSHGREQLHHVPANYKLYQQKSDQVKAALSEYDPHLRSYSLDEAYLDIGPYLALKLTNKGWSHDQIKATLAATDAAPVPQTATSEESLTTTAMVDSEREQSDECNVECLDLKPSTEMLLLGSSTNTSSNVEEVLSTFPPETCLECASQILSELRQRVFDATQGLTCSAGLAPNVMLAKMASDRNKPNGQVVVGPTQDNVLTFLHPMPTRKVPGIGRVTEKILRAFDIVTVQDLYQQRALVKFLFQPATARFLWLASLGCCSNSDSVNIAAFGNSPDVEDNHDTDYNNNKGGTAAVASTSNQKGISRERTFASGRPWSEVSARLEDIARGLSADMKRKNLWGRTITVKAKLHTFDVLSRSRTLPDHALLQDPIEMVQLAAEILRELKAERKGQSFSIRLLGVRCSNFATEREKVLAASASTMKQTSLASMEQFSLTATTTTAANEQTAFDHLKQPAAQTKRNMKANKLPQANHLGNLFERIIVQRSSVANGIESSAAADTMAASPEPEAFVPCPVCGTHLSINDNERLNRHLDSCLNASVVRNAVREESQDHATPVPQPSRRRGIADYFH
jgi:DNA polymerase kappa